MYRLALMLFVVLSACAADVAEPPVVADTALLGRTTCDGVLDEDARPFFGQLERFAFERRVYATRVDLVTQLAFMGEQESSAWTTSLAPEAQGVLSMSGSFGRFEVGTDHYVGLTKALRTGQDLPSEIVRLAYWDAYALEHGAGPYVLEFNQSGDDCSTTRY